ncbi:hypothetical protein C4K02_0244 [Pseudomonas synxantha]|nr:hypothetical protein C4K02_0244 [Pseudomonas synxantha]
MNGATSRFFGSIPQFFKRYEHQNVGGGLRPMAVGQAPMH